MRNRNIKDRLLIGFLVVTVFTAVVGVLGICGILYVNSTQNVLYDLGVNSDYCNRLMINLNMQRATYRDAVIHIDNEDRLEGSIASLTNLDEEYHGYIDYLLDNLLTAEGIAIVERISDFYESQYYPMRQELIRSIKEQNLTEAIRQIDSMVDSVDQLITLSTEVADWAVNVSAVTNEEDTQTAYKLVTVAAILSLGSVAVAIYLGFSISNGIAGPVRRMVQAADRVAKGDVDVDLDIKQRDEIGMLANSLQKMISSIQQQSEVLDRVAQGDYTVSVPVRSDKDIMNRSINRMLENSNQVLGKIRTASDEVTSGSRQIAQGAQNQAAGSSEQAVSIEQFSSSINEVLEQTTKNAKGAEKALAIIAQGRDLMSASNNSMQQMRTAMQYINESSQNMSHIIKVIEDIAFQTNILALNAAVEAARAGQHGKGFAVVADEVRNLASKSAAAANETSVLLAGSTQRVEEGNAIASQTSASLMAADEYSAESLAVMEQIVEASNQQAGAISEITSGIAQISKVVQDTSSTAQQSAAAAEQMSSQSSMLRDLVSRFKLKTTPTSQIDRRLYGGQQIGVDEISDIEPVDSTGRILEEGFSLSSMSDIKY